MRARKVETALRRVLRAVRPLVGSEVNGRNVQTAAVQTTAFSGLNVSSLSQAKRLNVAMVGGTLALAAALNNEAQNEQKKEEDVKGGYRVNPIQNVTALLRLYEQIDQNMSVFAARMLEDLERSVEKEKKANGGKLTLSPEQRALNMSIAFESTLEKVQDAVFRNNYVTKDQVQEAMQQLVTGTLRGGGPDGKITVAEAETIDDFVRKLGRLRWKVTGSREPLIPGAKSTWMVPEEKPDIEVTTVIRVMEELIPSLTAEMEKIATSLRKQKLADAEFRSQLSQQYVKASGKMTEEICKKFKLDMRAFQAALMYYHDNDQFEKTLAKLAEQQQKRYDSLRPLHFAYDLLCYPN
ncbi:hypothetical protein F442_13541 [Phytophthora nicotianae P10297]|uniref:Uncharacterized protein n=6 Tax=Phytophthora nicotianae TaxID=4792 RepID=V9ERB1_PHYNI|nr:hypothetical protein PPTG_03630 [Phytophthora nicotianae INRA-310]ETI41033.1 hypothetical protein F443_13677 [Phytophthora nicotianae P1569]ETK81142.1 hypothetical protein L915_13348 [Phytophthora nicotianae]ETO69730.1 hypothetical protein F444_13740 [Phytophthora nicotianae P1976]ETP38971.1 hypothetical protein F442_13541 [Phytophthora nicotianae P10297]ETI41066.1 hypothetical protein F443_13673 [Phytophthora nicotianae P1569]